MGFASPSATAHIQPRLFCLHCEVAIVLLLMTHLAYLPLLASHEFFQFLFGLGYGNLIYAQFFKNGFLLGIHLF